MVSGQRSYTLAYIAEYLGAELRGDALCDIARLADLDQAGSSDITFLSSKKYLPLLKTSGAGAVILNRETASDYAGNVLVVENPYLAYAAVSALFTTRPETEKGIDARAVIHPTARLGENVKIGPNCQIGEKAELADGVELMGGVVVGARSRIGKSGLVYPNVVIYHDVRIGDAVIIHANTTIGSDGFGFAPSAEGWQKIHQIGGVRIGNRVEIGASSTIDRGALGDTIIGDNVIIDNQVHIAHNVCVGDGTALAGCVGVAGSTKIGKQCLVAGAVAISGHIEIADKTTFHGGTIVTRGNSEPEAYASASPLQKVGAWRKNSVRFRQLDELFSRVKKLEKLFQEK